jgi:acyl-CoA thioester hydrolase
MAVSQVWFAGNPAPTRPQDLPLSKPIDPARLELTTYPVRIAIETQFRDMDIAAHLNNVAIAGYYESARARSNLAMFGNDFFRRSSPYLMVLAETNLRFLAEGNYPEPTCTGSGIGRIGNSSFVMQQALFQQGACIGLCDCVMVLTAAGKPTRIPEDVRHAMQSQLMPAH